EHHEPPGPQQRGRGPERGRQRFDVEEVVEHVVEGAADVEAPAERQRSGQPRTRPEHALAARFAARDGEHAGADVDAAEAPGRVTPPQGAEQRPGSAPEVENGWGSDTAR